MLCVQNMGLSSKQVSGGGGDGLDWVKNLMQDGALELPKISNQARQPQQQQEQPQQQQQQQQQQQHQMDPLKCPRCDSTNTKFCYYNNYNRLQPRHFCKSCRRHWTKGGTLRNVPVGGGRKNKRLKSSPTTTTTMRTAITNNINSNSSRSTTGNVSVVPQQHLPLGFGDHQKNMSEVLYQSLLHPTSVRPADYTDGLSDENNSSFTGPAPSLDSLLPLPTFAVNSSSSSSMSSFSGSIESTNYMLNYTGQRGTLECPSTPSIPWLLPTATNLVDSSSYLDWEDLNSLISSDLKQPWEVDS